MLILGLGCMILMLIVNGAENMLYVVEVDNENERYDADADSDADADAYADAYADADT